LPVASLDCDKIAACDHFVTMPNSCSVGANCLRVLNSMHCDKIVTYSLWLFRHCAEQLHNVGEKSSRVLYSMHCTSTAQAAQINFIAVRTFLKFWARLSPACSSPVPQCGGLWQPRFTIPEAPSINDESDATMPPSTHLFSSAM